jgi:D-lactate dehydrogenase (cytochrome)
MEQVEIFKELASGEEGGPLDWAERPEDRTRLWQARHDSYWAGLGLRPGASAMATDVCVPVSRLADCVTETYADIEEMGLIAPIVGHVGDGNFHVMPLIDMSKPEEVRAVELFNEKLVARALAMGGTCTGEHGVGSGKMKFLRNEHGAGVEVMKAIKRALDPDNILNPGKIVALP